MSLIHKNLANKGFLTIILIYLDSTYSHVVRDISDNLNNPEE